jgi:GWxTD domain-containing protein
VSNLRLLFSVVLVAFACGQLKTLTRADSLPEQDKLEYLVLASIDRQSAQDYASTTPGPQRDAFLDWFWRNHQPAPGRTTGQERAELHRRAAQARTFFGSVDLLNDDRVRTYIRFGPPRRDQYEPRAVETETSRIYVNPSEIWTYDSAGWQFDFVKTGTAYKLVGDSRFGFGAVMPALEPVDIGRPAPSAAPDARQLGLEIAVDRLRQQPDTVQVELQYGIPLRGIAALFHRNRQPLFHVSIDLKPRTPDDARALTYWVGTGLPVDTAAAEFAVGREVLYLPADIYTITVNVVTSDGKAAGSRSVELNLVDYVRQAQPSSDVLFYTLVDSTPQSPQFRRPDWSRVVPMVVPRVRAGRAFYVLYEIYNLALDSAGNHRAEASYELMEQDTRQLAVLPVNKRFITGWGTTGVAVERIHTMDLRPGRYLLISRTRDLNNSRTASLTAEFDILPRR